MIKKDDKKQVGAKLDQINSWYQDGIAYQTAIGLLSTVPQSVRFFEGEQWEAPTKATKHFPRPVVNIIEMICNNKKSQVLSSPIKIIYKSEEGSADVEKFNRFADYEQGRLRQDDINNKAALDGIIKGSYCLYYYWNDKEVGLDGLTEGDISVQLVDCTNVLFANPNEKDEQKQEWIMLISREDVAYIREIADSGVDKQLIDDDDSDSIYHEAESDTVKYATVMTRFFRVNGEVYFERATKQVIFSAARPLTPNPKHTKNVIEGKKDEQEIEKPEDRYLNNKPKATLYPIVFSSWKERDKSIYGRGEVETIIPNQKAINWSLGLQILVGQNEAMGVMVVSPDALKGQTITNEPGQVVVDYSKTGNGIRPLARQAMSKGSIDIVGTIADLTRTVTGSSEVMNGEVISVGMSGAAIAQLQSQALKPIEDLQKGFWRAMEKVGEILEQFLRFYFTGKKFQFKEKKSEEIKSDEFNSGDYQNTHFDVIAEAVAGTVMSDVGDINVLDNLYAKGAISLRTYINCYPQNAIANRQKIIESIEQEEQGIVQQLNAQLQQAQAALEQAAAKLQEQEKAMQNLVKVVNENQALKTELIQIQAQNSQITQQLIAENARLRAEYTAKINQANEILVGLGKKSQEYYKDAQSFAGEIAKSRGLSANAKQPTQGVAPQAANVAAPKVD